MAISDTFCWRIPKEHGCYIIGCLDLAIAITINMEIIHLYMYGNVDELTSLCQTHGTHNYDGENLNCPPAEINRTIMYMLAFVTFSCNFMIFMFPFSLFRAYKMRTPEILVLQIVSGIIKLMCIFVYAVLSALFLPIRGLVLLFVIVFEHYKIRHTLYMYIHLKNEQNVELLARLRQEAEKQIALLTALEPPSYEEATLLNPSSTIPVPSSGSQDTDQATRISVSPQDTEPSTNLENAVSLDGPGDSDHSARIHFPSTIPILLTDRVDIDESTRIGVSQDVETSITIAENPRISDHSVELGGYRASDPNSRI